MFTLMLNLCLCHRANTVVAQISFNRLCVITGSGKNRNGSFSDLYVSHPKSFCDMCVLPLDVAPVSLHPPII